jgi:hypothetical protein
MVSVEENEKNMENITPLLGVKLSEATTVNAQNATDSMVIDAGNFLAMFERVKNKPPALRRGNLFETIIAAKENSAKALDGTTNRTIVTHLDGRQTVPADLETYNETGRLITNSQAKFSVMKAPEITDRIIDPKYNGMDIYIPSNKIRAVKRELEQRIQNSNDKYEISQLSSTLKHIKSHNTSTGEVIIADKDPEKYASNLKFSIFKNELFQTTVTASATSAIMTGVLSIYKNYYIAENLTTEDRLKNVVKDTAIGAGRGAIIGGTSAAIRYSLVNSGSKITDNANIATSVAYCLYNTGVTVYQFATGKITDEEAILKLGNNGASTLAGIYTGGAVGAIFGPLGAVAGSLAGYFVTTLVYQSCTEILEKAKLTEAEAQRVISLSNAATLQMAESRKEFERLFEEKFKAKRDEFQTCFDNIDDGLETDDFVITTEALAQLANAFGKELKMYKFEDFDDFLTSTNKPLTI